MRAGNPARRALATAFLTCLCLAASSLRASSEADANAYLTVMVGRTIFATADDCVAPSGMMTLDEIVPRLASMGITVTAPVVPGWVDESATSCFNGDLYPSWTDLARLRDAYGLTAVSASQNYDNLPKMTTEQQFRSSCGSLRTLTAHGHDRAWGLLAYPNNEYTSDVQSSVISHCFAFGRTYTTVENPVANVQSSMTPPWLQTTVNLRGGLCNDAASPCYAGVAPDYRYASPDQLAASFEVPSGTWTSIQFYSFVTGSNDSGTWKWDCTDSDWRKHWTSMWEIYCWDDFATAASHRSANVQVVDPATVAEAWGRTPTPLVTIDATGRDYLTSPSQSVALDWHSPETGTYEVRVGGADCTSGNVVTQGMYGGSAKQDVIPGSSLPEGTDPIRVCLTNDAGHTGLAETTVDAAFSAPSVSSVSPPSGPRGGGTRITITGRNFTPDALVLVGGVAAAGVDVTSEVSITATTPAGSLGAAHVVVTDPAGYSASGPDDEFTFEPAPSVGAVTPSFGAASRETHVQITGSGFAPDATVSIGGASATDVVVASETSISATLPVSPGGSAGTYDVVVTQPGGDSEPSATDLFAWRQDLRNDSTTTISTSVDPSAYSEAIDLTATVEPSSATGTVTFYADGVRLGSAPLAGGVATLAATSLHPGTHAIVATYSGDDADWPSTSPEYAHTVTPASTTLALSSSPSPSVFGQAVTLTALVSPATATGTVTFLESGFEFDTVAIASGTALLSTTALNTGTHTFVALYNGNDDYAQATSAPIAHTVNPTSTTLTASKNPSPVGQTLTLTAKVTPSGVRGSVTFTDGQTVLSRVPVSLGKATFATSSLAVGQHSIVASFFGFGGGQSYSPSTSTPLTLSIVGPTSIAPGSVGQGATKLPVRVLGAGFEPGATARVSGTGVSLTSVTVLDASTISALAWVTSTASNGPRNVVVTNPSTGSGICAGCLVVGPHPILDSLSPSSLQTGAAGITVTVSGSAFQSGPLKLTLVGAQGTSATNVTAVGPTQATARFTIGFTATLGTFDVRLTNPDGGVGMCASCFTISRGPIVNGMTPSTVVRGTSYSFALTGANFAPGAVVNGPSGISYSNIAVASDGNQITGTMKVGTSASIGSALSVVVTNPASSGFGRGYCACVTVSTTATATSVRRAPSSTPEEPALAPRRRL